jgi:hypothetical protein
MLVFWPAEDLGVRGTFYGWNHSSTSTSSAVVVAGVLPRVSQSQLLYLVPVQAQNLMAYVKMMRTWRLQR